MVARKLRDPERAACPSGGEVILVLDTETFPIKPGRQFPRVVCVQTRDASGSRIELRDAGGLDRVERALEDPSCVIVGHDAAYDVGCAIATRPRLMLPALAAYEANRIVCTHVRESLGRIAEGTSDRHHARDLLSCVERWKIPHAFEATDKARGSDGVRVRFCDVDGVDPETWDPARRRYALADLIAGDLYEAQERAWTGLGWLADQYRRSRADFALRLTSGHGMRVDPRAVARFRELVEDEHADVRRALDRADPEALARFAEARGLDAEHAQRAEVVPFERLLVRVDGSKDVGRARARMERVCRARGIPIPATKTGKEKGLTEGVGEYVALDADACAASGDLQLRAFARYTSIGTLRGRADRLALAAEHATPVQPHFDALKKTGRTSCSSGDSRPGRDLLAIGDQTQNLNREPGLRECYTARDGCVVLSSDWKAAELHTLAQTCADLGLDSMLARVLRTPVEGREPDAHVWFAAIANGWSYAWALDALKGKHGPEAKKKVKAARQGAKACNFGFPGGLGIAKFRAWAAKTYGVIWTENEAAEKKWQWLDALPEMRAYFRWVDEQVNSGAPLRHFGSDRYRGDLTYTAAANSPFQGRCADMLVDALWQINATIHRERLPARAWNEAHDEILVEIREDAAHVVAPIVSGIMDRVGAAWCPVAPCVSEPALQRHWRKAAEPVYRGGRLIPYEDRDLTPEEIDGIRSARARGVDALRASWLFAVEVETIERIAA